VSGRVPTNPEEAGTTASAPARRALLGLFLACVAAFLVAGCSGGTGEAPRDETESSIGPGMTQEGAAGVSGDKPNIIFVLTDDLDYASIQKMPEINSLLRDEGAYFENAFISHPICCPSRSTILTGLYDHNHNVISNKPPDGGFQKFLSEGHEEDSIAVRLQEGGYRTGFFGKYLNGYPGDDPLHVPPGWDDWYGKLNGQKLYDYSLNENGEEVSYGSELEDFFTDVLSSKATDFVRSAAPEDQPFFAYVAPTAPHGPATPAERHKGALADEEAPRPPSYNEEDVSDKPSWIRDSPSLSEQDLSQIDNRYQRRLESMLAVDEMVGSLADELEAAGELENTYIFFTSDNGFEQGEHRIKGGKDRSYEESARVPFFVRGPGVAPASEVEELAVNTDFAPTFADLAGVEFPADGRSLAPVLRGEEATWRSAVLLERLPAQASDEEASGKSKGKDKSKGKGKGKAKTGAGGSPAFTAIRTEDYKYVEYENGDVELYDLEADPYELESLHKTADPALVEILKVRLEALRDCSGDECREAEDSAA
jgi:N-acetylglucosamine-6-sulfatase